MSEGLMWTLGLGGWAVIAVLANTVLLDWLQRRRGDEIRGIGE